jgi:hypothetical protein
LLKELGEVFWLLARPCSFPVSFCVPVCVVHLASIMFGFLQWRIMWAWPSGCWHCVHGRQVADCFASFITTYVKATMWHKQRLDD